MTDVISVCRGETNHISDQAKYMRFAGELKCLVSAKLLWNISAKLKPSMNMLSMCLDQYKYGYPCMKWAGKVGQLTASC